MGTHQRHEYFAQYRLVRPQGTVHGLERWVVLNEQSNTNHMLYRFAPSHDAPARRLFSAVQKMSAVRHPHLLRIESLSFDAQERLCVITPYTGNQDGLVTLADLLEQRDGKLEPAEAIRCITHLLEASDTAARAGIAHGSVDTDEILVDRFGSAQIELYGLCSVLNASGSHTDRVTDEVHSIIKIGYRMLVGLEPNTEDRITPTRVVRKLDKLWDRWFAIGLDPIDGFVSAEEALRMLPTNPSAPEAFASRPTRRPQVQIGSMLRRFRSASSRAR
ncbi:MAG: protein kinase family protein [Phycisphaerales bacterium]|nr:protein kinase family protein [Phycisphaerales bacterium]